MDRGEQDGKRRDRQKFPKVVMWLGYCLSNDSLRARQQNALPPSAGETSHLQCSHVAVLCLKMVVFTDHRSVSDSMTQDWLIDWLIDFFLWSSILFGLFPLQNHMFSTTTSAGERLLHYITELNYFNHQSGFRRMSLTKPEVTSGLFCLTVQNSVTQKHPLTTTHNKAINTEHSNQIYLCIIILFSGDSQSPVWAF